MQGIEIGAEAAETILRQIIPWTLGVHDLGRRVTYTRQEMKRVKEVLDCLSSLESEL